MQLTLNVFQLLQRLWLYESGGKAPHSKRFA
jgi:hypothetical protein